MDAWETLVSTSLIPSGDAWEHLINQGGGFGDATYIVHTDGMEVEVEDQCLTVTVDNSEVVVAVDNSEIEVQTDNDEIVVEICNGS